MKPLFCRRAQVAFDAVIHSRISAACLVCWPLFLDFMKFRSHRWVPNGQGEKEHGHPQRILTSDLPRDGMGWDGMGLLCLLVGNVLTLCIADGSRLAIVLPGGLYVLCSVGLLEHSGQTFVFGAHHCLNARPNAQPGGSIGRTQ